MDSKCDYLADNGECTDGCCISWVAWEAQDNKQHDNEWFCLQTKEYRDKFN